MNALILHDCLLVTSRQVGEPRHAPVVVIVGLKRAYWRCALTMSVGCGRGDNRRQKLGQIVVDTLVYEWHPHSLGNAITKMIQKTV